MIQRYDFGPLDGITKVVFRKVWHEHFGGADRYFIPFFSPTDHHTITPRDFRELDPANNGDLPVVPQIMSCKAPDFICHGIFQARVLEWVAISFSKIKLVNPKGGSVLGVHRKD